MNKNKIRLNNKPINLVLIVLFFMYSFTAFSQERIISGTVNDSYGYPIPELIFYKKLKRVMVQLQILTETSRSQ